MSVEGAVLGEVEGDVLGMEGGGGGAATVVGDVQTCIDAIARLCEQFKDLPNIRSLVCALATPAQAVDDALEQLLTERGVNVAAGAQLDVLGKIVGQDRDGLSDDIYRRYIRARIATNKSQGEPSDLILIARLILDIGVTDIGHLVIRTVADATFILEIHDLAVTDDVAKVLQDMLTSAVSAGVRVIVVYSRVVLADTFRFDVGPGWDQGHLARGIDDKSVI